jgi:hypothetical protein
MPCTESGACAPRKSDSNRATPIPVAWHRFLSVRVVMIGQAYAATAANAILGTFPSLLGSESGCRRGVRRWVAHRTRQLGFEIATAAASQFRNTSIFDTCLNAFEFQAAFTCYALSPFLGAHGLLVHSSDSANADEEYEVVHHEKFIITYIALAREDNIMHFVRAKRKTVAGILQTNLEVKMYHLRACL